MALIRVARIADLTEARVIEAALAAQGIPVLVQDAQFGQTDFLMQAAIAGFGILVPEEHAEEAAAFIREHRPGGPAAGPVLDGEADPDDDAAWEKGRRKRRNLVVRWLVVIAFFGPVAAFVLVSIVSALIERFAG